MNPPSPPKKSRASHPMVVRFHAPVGIYLSRLIDYSEGDMWMCEDLHHFQYGRCSIPWIINSRMSPFSIWSVSSNNRNVYSTKSDHHHWMHSSWSTKRKWRTSLHFQEVEKIKCHIMQRDRGNLLRLERASCLKHHLISRITIMLLAVLIRRWRTLLSTPVWDVFTRLFCLKSSRRAGEEPTLSFYY